MNAPPTLLQLLEQSTAGVLVYDVGRRIGALPRQDFVAFEAAEGPYPLPMQHKAWFALVQHEDDSEPVIWFLCLSLDEQGLMIPAERDYLLKRLLESAQARQRGDDPQTFLRDNPHAFTPREERMALFHARLSADLGRPPSRFYEHALDYFSGRPGWDQWGFVGYQGIADLACRHSDAPLDAAVPALPAEPLVALCHCLESQHIGESLTAALLERLAHELAADSADIGVLAALVRGLSSRTRVDTVHDAIDRLLDSAAGSHVEILAAVSGRAWEVLGEPALLNNYLRRLTENEQPVFEHCVRDLLSLPSLATDVRTALRAPDQHEAVRLAFTGMTSARDPSSA